MILLRTLSIIAAVICLVFSSAHAQIGTGSREKPKQILKSESEAENNAPADAAARQGLNLSPSTMKKVDMPEASVPEINSPAASKATSEQEKFKRDIQEKRTLGAASDAIGKANKPGIQAPEQDSPMKKDAGEFMQQKAKQKAELKSCLEACKKQHEIVKGGIELRYPCKMLSNKIPQCPPEKSGEMAQAEAGYKQCQKDCSSPKN